MRQISRLCNSSQTIQDKFGSNTPLMLFEGSNEFLDLLLVRRSANFSFLDGQLSELLKVVGDAIFVFE